MRDHRSRATPARPPRRRWGPWLAVLVGALTLALGVAACSGGDKTSGVASLGDRVTATTSAGGSQDERRAALNFARCMRQHGINMPDPNPEIQWGQLNQAPGWDAAWQACRQLLPASAVQQGVPPSAEELAQLRAFAVCMRAHDIDMSDPQPNGDMTTGAATRDQEQNDPGFKAAWAACRDKLPAEERQPRK
jgi:hypothetical protein